MKIRDGTPLSWSEAVGGLVRSLRHPDLPRACHADQIAELDIQLRQVFRAEKMHAPFWWWIRRRTAADPLRCRSLCRLRLELV